MRNLFSARAPKLVAMLVAAMLVGLAFATPATPAAALDLSTVATAALADLTGIVGDALPYIAGAIGLGIVIRWARKVFGF